jgi:hypothetical protein
MGLPVDVSETETPSDSSATKMALTFGFMGMPHSTSSAKPQLGASGWGRTGGSGFSAAGAQEHPHDRGHLRTHDPWPGGGQCAGGRSADRIVSRSRVDR